MKMPLVGAALLLSVSACTQPKLDETNSFAASRLPASGLTYQAPAEAKTVIAFWQGAGPDMWFAKDPSFDRRFRELFAAEYEQAAHGELNHWTQTPEGALGLLILLDQYPRNSFRNTAKMYATDEAARKVADAAIAAGFDRLVPVELQLFVYLPFGHSEDPADQARSVSLASRLGEPHLSHAKHHQDIITRFGRFPHRNPILGRAMKPEEQAYLDNGGFKG